MTRTQAKRVEQRRRGRAMALIVQRGKSRIARRVAIALSLHK